MIEYNNSKIVNTGFTSEEIVTIIYQIFIDAEDEGYIVESIEASCENITAVRSRIIKDVKIKYKK